ncbi:MAG: hypothetical protein ACLTQH_01675 [Fusobacterium sp.]
MKRKTHDVEATVLVDLDNATPYSIIVNRKNTVMIDLMKAMKPCFPSWKIRNNQIYSFFP